MSGMYMLADALLGALAAKLERDVILAKIQDLEAKGATPEQLTDELRKMRDEAITKAQLDITSQL